MWEDELSALLLGHVSKGPQELVAFLDKKRNLMEEFN